MVQPMLPRVSARAESGRRPYAWQGRRPTLPMTFAASSAARESLPEGLSSICPLYPPSRIIAIRLRVERYPRRGLVTV